MISSNLLGMLFSYTSFFSGPEEGCFVPKSLSTIYSNYTICPIKDITNKSCFLLEATQRWIACKFWPKQTFFPLSFYSNSTLIIVIDIVIFPLETECSKLCFFMPPFGPTSERSFVYDLLVSSLLTDLSVWNGEDDPRPNTFFSTVAQNIYCSPLG